MLDNLIQFLEAQQKPLPKVMLTAAAKEKIFVAMAEINAQKVTYDLLDVKDHLIIRFWDNRPEAGGRIIDTRSVALKSANKCNQVLLDFDAAKDDFTAKPIA